VRPLSTIVQHAAVGLALIGIPLSAQWPQVKTRRVPLTRDGKPDLNAPPPKFGNGKIPDLSGIWNSIKTPCEKSEAAKIFGCSDIPFGAPVGIMDVTATGSEEGQAGTTVPLPYQPWAEAQVKQNLADIRKDDPTTRCLPISPVRQWSDFFPQKIVQTAEAAKENFFKTQVPFGSIIYNEAKKQNVPPELVAAVVHTESKFKPNARSGAGAMGLMQLVPKTGRWMGAQNLMNPNENIMAGTKYLKYLNDRFNGDQQKVIAAYNAGEGNVRRFGGVPPFKETRNYVQRVKSFQSDLQDQLSSTTQIADAATR